MNIVSVTINVLIESLPGDFMFQRISELSVSNALGRFDEQRLRFVIFVITMTCNRLSVHFQLCSLPCSPTKDIPIVNDYSPTTTFTCKVKSSSKHA